MSTDSTDSAYAERLRTREAVWWKRMLDVQRPYRAHLRRLKLGRVLDVGCGIGRNLGHLDGQGVGVDPNVDAVATCKARGLTAFTPAELEASEHARPGAFDALLISHVLEHLSEDAALALITTYLPYVRSGGRAVFITPQEAGYRSDPTHVSSSISHGSTRSHARPGSSRSPPTRSRSRAPSVGCSSTTSSCSSRTSRKDAPWTTPRLRASNPAGYAATGRGSSGW